MAQKVTGTISCPPLRQLRAVSFNASLAKYLVELGLSGEGTIDWALTQVYDRFDGKLKDYNGKEIKLDRRHIDDDFGQDTRRRINAYKERAKRPFKQRLQLDLADRIMWLHFAREIAERTKGA